MCCSLFSWNVYAVGELFYDEAAERTNVRSVLKLYVGATSVQATLWGESEGELRPAPQLPVITQINLTVLNLLRLRISELLTIRSSRLTVHSNALTCTKLVH